MYQNENNYKTKRVYKTVGELLEILKRYDSSTPLRVLDRFSLYGMSICIPQSKNIVILVPNKSHKKCVTVRKS